MAAADIAQALENVMRSPVLDETGLAGVYDVKLEWDHEDPESLARELRRRLGLELRQARRSIELLVVTEAP